MRMAALAVAMTLVFSGLALARDHDDNHHYRDRHESSHNNWKRGHDHDRDHWRGQDRSGWRDRDHDRDHDRRQRDHHDSWWHRDRNRDSGYYGGQVYNRIPNGYPGTYGYPGGGYGYPNGGYGYPGGVYGRGNDRNMGYNVGYQDGSYRARKDISENKPFNPNPRGDFGNRDHGYNSSYGDKNSYRAEYTQGYMAGYQTNYRGGRGWGY